ncbi:MAG: DUF3865 domain-containing protein [Hyalangium sp.]|uniref:DUF3865 domain-containing protein n=1 Tax=Hyalangium sp. TaxID=2028555 RepID=UPI003899EE8C
MISEAQYTKVDSEIQALLQMPNKQYATLAPKLEALISDTYGALRTDTNPVITNLPHWDIDDLKFLVKEYSGFSNESIHMFYDATIRLRWDGVKAEVDRNVAEEMGALTDGIPHLELMRRGYREDLGVETDGVEYSACTRGFLDRMRSCFRNANNAFVCGALLAFEATATFEFKGVEKILKTLKARQGGEIAKNSLTGIYIQGHVADAAPGGNPEDDHYAGMRNAIGKYVTAENASDLVRGFVSVCTALNAWWEQLAIEVYVNRLTRRTQAEPRGNEAHAPPARAAEVRA